MPEAVVLLLAGAVVVLVSWAVVRLERHENNATPAARTLAAAWAAASQRAKLRPGSNAGRASGTWITADGREVRVELESRVTGAEITWVVDVNREGSQGLTVKRQGAPREIAAGLLGRDFEIGDPAFDRDFSVRGNAAWALAVLDKKTRRDLAALLQGAVRDERGRGLPVEATLRDGALRLVFRHRADLPIPKLSHQLGEVLHTTLSLASRLALPRDPAARLAANLGSGAQAHDEEVGVRRTSLRLLLSQFPRHSVTAEVIRRGLEDEDPGLRLEAQIASGQATEESLLPWILQDDSLLAKTVVQALGRLGTAAAVPRLRALENGVRLDLARAARQAIAQIQARLEGAEAGQLSLAGSEGGGLSLAEEAEPGRLTLARPAAVACEEGTGR